MPLLPTVAPRRNRAAGGDARGAGEGLPGALARAGPGRGLVAGRKRRAAQDSEGPAAGSRSALRRSPTRPPLRGPVGRAERPHVFTELRSWASPSSRDRNSERWDPRLQPLTTRPAFPPPRRVPAPYHQQQHVSPLSLPPLHLSMSFSLPFHSFSCFFLSLSFPINVPSL